MKDILITGATGNIGQEVIRKLFENKAISRILAGVRNIEKAKPKFSNFEKLEYVKFDFEDPSTFRTALINVDSVFLLRPPNISDVEKYFRPLISYLKELHVKQVIFLSVQGVETSRLIPHHKIEDLIIKSELDYIFLRPSYFMQNLTTTLVSDIRKRRAIILPAGHAKFNWVDVENIGEVSAILLERFIEFKNSAVEITGTENENFESVVEQINYVLARKIRYININPFNYYVMKRREGIPRGQIIIMILLHYLPRFQKEPRISFFYEKLTGKKPTKLKIFIEREKEKLDS